VEAKTWHDYLLHDGYLSFGNLLCIPNTFLLFSVVQKLHKQGHFGTEKTLHLVRERFFWLNMSKDIKLFIKGCQVCQAQLRTVHTFARSDLTMEDISMDYGTRKKNDIIFVVGRSIQQDDYLRGLQDNHQCL
jgi:Integrase zinc binding domain